MKDWNRVLGDAKFVSKSGRFRKLVGSALSQFPATELQLRSTSKVQLRKRSKTTGTVGLTTYCCVEPVGTGRRGQRASHGRQRIIFYSELLDQLSDEAATGVIAHELAHAWLNEYVRPEASEKREKDADELARRWGYGKYLDALEAETVQET